jgi:hypothetical protein
MQKNNVPTSIHVLLVQFSLLFISLQKIVKRKQVCTNLVLSKNACHRLKEGYHKDANHGASLGVGSGHSGRVTKLICARNEYCHLLHISPTKKKPQRNKIKNSPILCRIELKENTKTTHAKLKKKKNMSYERDNKLTKKKIY